MKAKVVYIEREKAKRINELLEAEKEFLNENKPLEAIKKKSCKKFSGIIALLNTTLRFEILSEL